MFTGLIEATGRIEAVDGTADGKRLTVMTALASELRPGDSVAVSGVCLTVVSHDTSRFTVDLSRETLAVTSLDAIEVGRLVNLERPLKADARLGGHFVLGHVDAAARLLAWRRDGDGWWLEVEVPDRLVPYLIPKGSIAVDGISLTIAALSERRVGVQIIPFTFEHTALSETQAGDLVNLEADVLGKYVARALAVGGPAGRLAEMER